MNAGMMSHYMRGVVTYGFNIVVSSLIFGMVFIFRKIKYFVIVSTSYFFPCPENSRVKKRRGRVTFHEREV